MSAEHTTLLRDAPNIAHHVRPSLLNLNTKPMKTFEETIADIASMCTGAQLHAMVALCTNVAEDHGDRARHALAASEIARHEAKAEAVAAFGRELLRNNPGKRD